MYTPVGLGDARPIAPPMTPARRLALAIPLMMTPRGRGMGAVQAPYLTRPAPDGNPGIEIVDPSGNVVYDWQTVRANPGLISQLGSVCPGGMLPTWFPGGESVCADSGAVVPGEGNSPYAQFEYPINGQCNPGVWCFTGSNLNDPNSYTWTGGGTPDVLNPAIVMGAPSLPKIYNTPVGGPTLPPRTVAPPMSPVFISTDPMPIDYPQPMPLPVGGPIRSPVQPVSVPVPIVATPPVPAASPVAAGAADLSSVTNFLTQPVSLFGFSVPAWGIGAAALGLLWFMSSMSSKR